MKNFAFIILIAVLACCSPAGSGDRIITLSHRITAWSHQFTLPAGWDAMEMPESDVTLEKIRTDPKAVIPLGLYRRPDFQSVFTIAVRPAFSDGTLSDWLAWFCAQENIKPGDIETAQLDGGLSAAVCTATQEQAEMSLRMRMACVEDGGNCFLLVALSPEDHWDHAAADCWKIIQSWKLLHPEG